MSQIVIVEPTTLIRDWLRGLALSPGAHIYASGRPASEPLPSIVIWRVGGGPVDYQDDGIYQFDCLAANAKAAAALASELTSALLSATLPVALSDETRLDGFYGVQMLPDFDTDPELARHIVTAQATTISIPATP